MAEGESPVAFNAETPIMTPTPTTSEPKKLPLELIDGFYKFKAMEDKPLVHYHCGKIHHLFPN